MDTQTEIQYWLDAAARKDREGEHSTATTFRNLAWLLEHVPTGHIKSASDQMKEFVSANFGVKSNTR